MIAGFTADLKACYRSLVVPTMTASITASASNTLSRSVEGEAALNYNLWLIALQDARAALADPAFTVSPEYSESRSLAVKHLRGWYEFWNRECVSDAAGAWQLAIKDARIGLLDATVAAGNWNLATRANRLDRQTLLDELCVQVVIKPDRGYSAVIPNTTGSVVVNAGFTIAGGPLRTDAGVVRVRISQTGSQVVAGEGPIAADGTFSASLDWPAGLDPIHIDILATLIDHETFLNEPEISIALPTDIQRFDRITKSATRLSFTFTNGFDGWSSGTVGSQKISTTWGLVDHLSLGGGVIHLDGRGTGSGAKAWIYRTITLPDSATTFSFDVSAEVIAGSSSSVRVVIEVGDVTKNFTFAVSNGTNKLSFKRERVDISQWAGRRVRIFVEQNYNGLSGFDKEIYVDNIKIETSLG